ncbi:uncharacterized protein LOC116931668 isoform X1 [Daphnia magna]|uniref:uncharacterized protein LOC116931668 isoform X1 n=1 Tax=Daphnia magna TaxID=35525 RepID=UPI001E1BC305|nr:uncharacterized protein LOC116931668 isoform X1 [Daphnia magna]
MNNESTCHQPSTLTVDSLSYKELQGLAMSLSLPGKMKQGVLVEAIKARQNHNEQAVAMILEANRQRRILKREQQLRHQQQQLLKFKDVDNKRKCLARPKIKRSASEMEMDPTYIVDQETFKRSKLAAALIQQTRQSRGPAFSFTALTTGATSLTIRKEHTYQPTHVSTSNMGGCSSWDQAITAESVAPLPSQSMPIIPKALPDLSKELSILPVLSDCSAVTSSSTNNEDLCCSVGSVSSGATSTSSWQSSCSGENHQSLPQSSFEDCDSAWIGADESYDLNTWKNMHNSKSNSNSYENTAPPVPPNSSAGYFEAAAAAAAAPDIFINNGDIYSPDDFIANSSASGANYNAQDYQLTLESSSSFQDVKPDPSTWSESVIQPSHTFQQPQQQFQQQSNGVCTVSTESRVTNGGCCYDFDCHKLGGPFFRIQRPGNSTPVFVHSGRSLTLSTFCNMLPRVASFVQ